MADPRIHPSATGSDPRGLSAPRDWCRISMKAADGHEPSSADVDIYDEIGDSWFGGTSAKDFAEQIAALEVDQLNVHLNSPGGDAWDGLAIMNSLRRHPASVNVTVDGIAASAASVIAMAGDHITMNRGAELMIHDASGGVWGNAQDMRSTADVLDKLSNSYADSYAARAGGDRAQWRSAMTAETWYSAEEAVEAGLADEWADAPAAEARFDLNRYKFQHHGRADAPAPVMLARKRLPASEPEEPNEKEGVAVAHDDDLVKGLRDRLGVTDTGLDATGLLKVLDAKWEELRNPEPTVPEGAAVIDKEVLAELQSAAEDARALRAEQVDARQKALITAALEDGRISSATADSWRAALASDEEHTQKLLESLPKNTAVHVKPFGYTGIDGADEETVLYEAIFGKKEN